MIQHEQSCEMDNKQTTGPGQKLILKGTFVIILIFQKLLKKTRWDIIPRVRLGGCLFKAEHLLAFPTYFFGVGSLIKPM